MNSWRDRSRHAAEANAASDRSASAMIMESDATEVVTGAATAILDPIFGGVCSVIDTVGVVKVNDEYDVRGVLVGIIVDCLLLW